MPDSMGSSHRHCVLPLDVGLRSMRHLEKLIRVGKLIVTQDEKQSIIAVQSVLESIQARMSKSITKTPSSTPP